MIQLNSNIFPKTDPAYIIGGSVRDLLLSRTPIDYDIAVSGNPEKYATALAATVNGRIVRMGKSGKMIIRVVSDDTIFDITPLAGGSLEADLAKRDFTINAMAYSLQSREIIDRLGGMKDLADKKIRMVSKTVFRDDPIRLIRAFRMGAGLGFELDPPTVSAIGDDAGLIRNTAGERIRSELFKLLQSRQSHYYLRQMDSARLLTVIFPELGPTKGCFQNRHHRHDVFEHTMSAYYHLEAMLNSPGAAPVEDADPLVTSVDEDHAALLKCAILFHDIGKPSKRTENDGGEARFFGHARESATMAAQIFNRLKFSNREKRFLDFIIRNHVQPLLLYLTHKNDRLTTRGQTRFYMKCGKNTPFLLLHALADIMGKSDDFDEIQAAYFVFIAGLIRIYFSEFKPRNTAPPLITGHDLIEKFGLTPSPLFGTILDRVKEARLSNKIENKGKHYGS